jgi:subtilisin family serine protease
MIGSWSTDAMGNLSVSAFSNVGACVSFFAPGEHIVSESPDGFLAVLNGTSFAAPLLVRHLSMMPVGTTPAAMRDALSGPFLPAQTFPAELLYDSAAPGSVLSF